MSGQDERETGDGSGGTEPSPAASNGAVKSVGENTARLPILGGAGGDETRDESAADATGARALAERAAMIELCLYALDRSRSDAVAQRIIDGLAAVGVVTTTQDGERFDPSCHEADGTVATEDPDQDGLVAGTEAPGFSDRGRLLRPPVVLVYQEDRK